LSKGITADIVIDVLGYMCPVPLVETKKALRKMQVGQVLEVIGDHSASLLEIPNSMRENGNEVLAIEKNDGSKWHMFILKKK
jgi:TusA-related sulfurtransferase